MIIHLLFVCAVILRCPHVSVYPLDVGRHTSVDARRVTVGATISSAGNTCEGRVNSKYRFLYLHFQWLYHL